MCILKIFLYVVGCLGCCCCYWSSVFIIDFAKNLNFVDYDRNKHCLNLLLKPNIISKHILNKYLNVNTMF